MFGSLSGILGGIGAITGALGGNKTESIPTQISGYQSLPKEIQDYLIESVFPRITAWGETPYPTVPLRRADAEDYDPVFGSKSRQYLQQYYDNQRLAEMAKNRDTGAAGATSAAEQKAMADMEARMAAREYFGGAGGTMAQPASTNTAQARMGQMYKAGLFDDKGLSDIGRFIQAAGGGTSAAGYDMANAQDPKLMQGFQGAYLSALLEALKRKGVQA